MMKSPDEDTRDRPEGKEAPWRDDSPLDYLTCEELGVLVDRAISYWRSIELAVDRNELTTSAVHFRQVVLITNEVGAILRRYAPRQTATA